MQCHSIAIAPKKLEVPGALMSTLFISTVFYNNQICPHRFFYQSPAVIAIQGKR